MKYDMLVNKEYPISKEFKPDKLVHVDSRNSTYLDSTYELLLVEEVLLKFNELSKDARKLGYEVEVNSAYRTYEYQQKILKRKKHLNKNLI